MNTRYEAERTSLQVLCSSVLSTLAEARAAHADELSAKAASKRFRRSVKKLKAYINRDEPTTAEKRIN